MSRKRLKQSIAALISATMISAQAAPVAAATVVSHARPPVSTFEIYSKSGAVKARYEQVGLATQVGTRLVQLRSLGNTKVGHDVVVGLRKNIANFKSSKMKNLPDFSSTLAVLDAIEAQTPEEAHRILSKLPAIVTHGFARKGRLETVVYVNGVLKTRMVEAVTHGGPSIGTSNTAVECGIEPGDACLTQQEIDDYSGAVASMDAEFEALSASSASEEQDCWSQRLCWVEGAAPNTPSVDRAIYEHMIDEANPITASKEFENGNCAGEFLVAAGGSALFIAESVAMWGALMTPGLGWWAFGLAYAKYLGTLAVAAGSIWIAYQCYKEM